MPWEETSPVKVTSQTIRRTVLQAWARLRGYGVAQKYSGDEQPLRSELFSADQMKQHGKTLAVSTSRPWDAPRTGSLPRLAENERVLIETRDLVTEAVKTNRRITPAGEWLLDNFYLIEEQIRTARRHLPKGYSRELPSPAERPVGRLPARVRHRPGDDLARRRTG